MYRYPPSASCSLFIFKLFTAGLRSRHLLTAPAPGPLKPGGSGSYGSSSDLKKSTYTFCSVSKFFLISRFFAGIILGRSRSCRFGSGSAILVYCILMNNFHPVCVLQSDLTKDVPLWTGWIFSSSKIGLSLFVGRGVLSQEHDPGHQPARHEAIHQ